MSWLSPDELEKLSTAESLFPSPIPVQSVSSDEFIEFLTEPAYEMVAALPEPKEIDRAAGLKAA